MRSMTKIAAGCLGAALLAVARCALAGTEPADVDQIIVKYKREPSAAQLAARMSATQQAGLGRALTFKHLRRGALGMHVLRMNRALTGAEARDVAREIMANDPNVEYAEPDLRMYPTFVPNDPQYSQQWHYYEATGGINLPAAWDRATGSGVNVAVIDTGYRPHADLAANIVGGYDFITNAADARDSNGRDSDPSDQGDWRVAGDCGLPGSSSSSWHGTHVAGTIAARTNNSLGVAGVAFNARIVPVRVLGRCGGTTSDIADAIVWASGGTVSGVPANPNPARVINMSLGSSSPAACGATYQNAINSARSRNTVVVVAAGNSATNADHPPGNCAGVITVAATNRAGGRASYSNFGSAVEIAAPGGETAIPGNGVLSTLNSGTSTPGADSYVYYQGTSMATPHVAGVVALMLELVPTLTPDQVLNFLQSTARAFPAACTGCGAGIVNAAAALNAAAPPGGGQPGVVQVSDMTLQAFDWMPPTYAFYHLSPSGDIYTSSSSWGDHSAVDSGDWISPKNGMANYQARFSQQSGDCQGTFNTWMTLNNTSFAEVQVGALVENTNTFCSFLVEIRAAANPSVIVDSAQIFLNANTGT